MSLLATSGLQGFRVPRPQSQSMRASENPLVDFQPPTETNPTVEPLPRDPCEQGTWQLPPVRFLPLQRLPGKGQRHCGQACRAHPPAPSGFRNLLTLSSARNLPALFHAGSAPGIRPFRAFAFRHPPAQPYCVSTAVPLMPFRPSTGTRTLVQDSRLEPQHPSICRTPESKRQHLRTPARAQS